MRKVFVCARSITRGLCPFGFKKRQIARSGNTLADIVGPPRTWSGRLHPPVPNSSTEIHKPLCLEYASRCNKRSTASELVRHQALFMMIRIPHIGFEVQVRRPSYRRCVFEQSARIIEDIGLRAAGADVEHQFQAIKAKTGRQWSQCCAIPYRDQGNRKLSVEILP